MVEPIKLCKFAFDVSDLASLCVDKLIFLHFSMINL